MGFSHVCGVGDPHLTGCPEGHMEQGGDTTTQGLAHTKCSITQTINSKTRKEESCLQGCVGLRRNVSLERSRQQPKVSALKKGLGGMSLHGQTAGQRPKPQADGQRPKPQTDRHTQCGGCQLASAVPSWMGTEAGPRPESPCLFHQQLVRKQRGA